MRHGVAGVKTLIGGWDAGGQRRSTEDRPGRTGWVGDTAGRRAGGQIQARGSATSSVTRSGSVPAATSATLTNSRISRSLARNAIQTS